MELTKSFISVNAWYANFALVENLLLDLHTQVNELSRIPKFDNERKRQAQDSLKELVWKNFPHMKSAIHLIPKTTPIGEPAMDSNYLELEKQVFSSVEYKLRTSHQLACNIARAQADEKGTGSAAGKDNAEAKGGNIFDMVFNYFKAEPSSEKKKDGSDNDSLGGSRLPQHEEELQAFVALKQ